jgi:molybdate transport system substrate-binding protein
VKRVKRMAALGIAISAVLVATLTGCGSSSTDARNKKLVVFAAASLKKTFTDIGEQFKTDNPGASIDFNFAGSSDLATQLTQGARADVFASADTKNMDKVAQAGLLAADPVNFASNTMVIVVPPGNPKAITLFKDLAKPGLNVVVCEAQVPCGSATQKLEKATLVTIKPVSEESSVTDVLNKVTSGQADAGIVYLTDAIGAGDGGGKKVSTVQFPEADVAVNTYPIAVLKSARAGDLATKFAALVTGDAGQKILQQAGFAKP